MNPRSVSRRAFLGLAAAAAAPAAVVAAVRAAGSAGAEHAAAAPPVPRRRPVSENQLPGDPGWKVSHLGEPDAMTGYADRYSVLPGEPRAFADGPAAARHPARDNLEAMREWAGDPIAAQRDLWPPIVV